MTPNQRKGILMIANIPRIIKMMIIITAEACKIFGDNIELFLIYGESVTFFTTNQCCPK
jgi:hypothetical protein